MKLKEIIGKYKDEWVLAEVLTEGECGRPEEVRLIEHSKSRDDTYKAMKANAEKFTYHFFTGKIPAKGYAVAF